MNFLYENLVKGHSNMYQLNPNLLAESFNYYFSQSCRNDDKSVSPKSFSIESILGFPNSSSSSKNVFCNQLALSEYSIKNGHYSVPEFVPNSTIYRPVTSQVLDSAKVKGKQLFTCMHVLGLGFVLIVFELGQFIILCDAISMNVEIREVNKTSQS